MSAAKRPIPVTFVAIVYIAAGTIGFTYHFQEFLKRTAFHSEFLWIELSESLAILFGAFLLRGKNWARWGALAWMTLHVVRGAFHSFSQFAAHVAIFILIARFLLNSEATAYFRPRAQSPVV